MDFKGWSLLFDLSPVIWKPETSLLRESTHTSQHTQKIKEQLIYQLQKRAIHHYLHNTFHFQLLTSFLTLDVPTHRFSTKANFANKDLFKLKFWSPRSIFHIKCISLIQLLFALFHLENFSIFSSTCT